MQRLATLLEQSKNKELQLFEENGLLKNANEALSDEAERLKSEIRYKNNTYPSSHSAYRASITISIPSRKDCTSCPKKHQS